MADPKPDRKPPEGRPDFRQEAARLLHDLSTPLLTVRALATLIPSDGEGADLTRQLEAQLDRINGRLDAFWQAVDTPRTVATPNPAAADTICETPNALRILLVDDDDIHREVGCRLLARLGHHATPCDDIAEAGRLCTTNRYDAIFLDQHGPGMLGSDLARHYSVSMASPAPWIIGMSSDPRQAEMRDLCLSSGMQDYMEKPITTEKLAAALNRIPTR